MTYKVIDYKSGVHINELPSGTIFKLSQKDIEEYLIKYPERIMIKDLFITIKTHAQKVVGERYVLAVSLRNGGCWFKMDWTPDLEIIRYGEKL